MSFSVNIFEPSENLLDIFRSFSPRANLGRTIASHCGIDIVVTSQKTLSIARNSEWGEDFQVLQNNPLEWAVTFRKCREFALKPLMYRPTGGA